MTSGRAIDEATWFRYQDLRDGGLSMYGAAKKIGVSYRAASDFEKGIGSAVGRAAKKAFDQARTPAPFSSSVDVVGARRDIARHRGAALDPLYGQVAGPLALDG